MHTIKIGGVPEHFNLPIMLGIEAGRFAHQGLDVCWKECPSGTGAMCQELRSGELDMAILLTEGILKDIAQGNPARIIKVHVETPLKWGIHVAVHSSIRQEAEIFEQRYAISRFNSGSHLMALVHARSKGHQIHPAQFVEVGDILRAEAALLSNRAEVFFWEKYMTAPMVEKGTLRRVGEFPTPWPCFVIAAREDFIAAHASQVSQLLQTINEVSEDFTHHPLAAELITSRFSLQQTQVEKWLSETRWRCNNTLEPQDFYVCLQHLHEMGLIPVPLNEDQYLKKC